MAYGYSITEILNEWEQFGVFAYVLPFLLIFAIVFGILNKSKLLGENKGVQATIGLAVGLLSLQFNMVTNFYSIIFPHFGIGIAVLLISIILVGISGDKIPWMPKFLFWIGAIIALVVILFSFSDYNWFGGNFLWANSMSSIIAGILIIAAIAFIVFGGNKG
ncbi:MAG: hypothetical protein WC867_06815 [Candidatus Pacearchaeota archaeon]|jgi:hypothetical protein